MPELDNNMRFEKPGDLLREKQTGISSEVEEIEQQKLEVPRRRPKPVAFTESLKYTDLSPFNSEDLTQEALAAGFGRSRYDVDFQRGKDVEQGRALAQSNFSKIGTGFMKGAVTAVATALNTTVGTVFGVGSSLYELAADANGNGRGVMDTIDAGVNNWLSEQTVKLQDWSERMFPNYRTQEERSDKYQQEWYKHVGTANFIGDSILKNFGFTVGAIGGGLAWSKVLGKMAAKKLANNIMKGAVASAEGSPEASELMQSAAQMLNAGKTQEAADALARAEEIFKRGAVGIVNQDKIVANVLNAGKTINKTKARLQLYGSVVGAMGEGTVEGLMAKNEFLENFNRNTNRAEEAEMNSLTNSILASGNRDWIVFDSYETPNGIQKVPRLTQAGIDELHRREVETAQKYDEIRQFAEQQGDRLASTTFLLNLPILTASNTYQFGRMFSGGWKTSRNAMKGVSGGLAREMVNIEGQAVPKIVGQYSSKYAEHTARAIAGKTILDALKISGSEAFEEMAQGTVSSGAKRVADANVAAFNNHAYDLESVNSARRWFEEMYGGGSEYLGDFKNWQEGFLGALTGLFGIPGRRWGGGIVGAYQNARDNADATNKAATELNNLVNSEEFQDRWKGYIRHMKYDNDMEAAIQADDQNAWQDANDSQIVSDIISFADAGKLDDLNQIADYFVNIKDADELKEAINTEEGGGTSSTNAPEKLVGNVQERAKEIKNTIQQYKDLYDALSSRAPVNASKDFLNELVATAMKIKRYEQRFLTMFGETMNALEPHLEMISSFTDEGTADVEKHKRQFQDVRNGIESIFGNMTLPVNMPKPIRDRMNNILNVMKEYAKSDAELSSKIDDMEKIATVRQEFFYKLQYLQTPKGQKAFENEAVTPEKVADAAEEAISREEVNGLDTFTSIRDEYLKRDAKGKADFIQSLEKVSDSNQAAKDFVSTKRRYDDFRAFAASNIQNRGFGTQILIDDLMDRVKSEDELLSLPDSAFMDFDSFRVRVQTPSFISTENVYAEAKAQIRDAMNVFVEANNLTHTRKSMSTASVTPTQAPVTNPTGPDAAQPGSVSPTPTIISMKGLATRVEKEVIPTAEQAPAMSPEVEDDGVPPMKNSMTPNELALSAIDAAQFDIKPQQSTVSVPGKGKQETSYHCSAPEIDNADEEHGGKGAMIARKAIENRDPELYKTADLRDFPDSSAKEAENYRMTFDKLRELGAFDAVNMDLNVDDEIEFVYDPNIVFDERFPKQIMVRRKSDGQVLTLLHSDTVAPKYVGLRAFRATFWKEYEDFAEQHPNEPFVFRKTSRIWLTRPGYVAYDYTGTGEKDIYQLPNYSDDAPIVMVGRDGRMRVVRGSDASVVDKVSPNFNNAEQNIAREAVGSLYYLVRSPHGQYEYIPIALRTIRFNPDNMNDDKVAFESVRKSVRDIISAWNNTNDEAAARISIGELGKLIDLHNVNFNIIGTGADATLKITVGPDGGTQTEVLSTPFSSLSSDDLLKIISGLNRHFQIDARGEKNQSKKINNFIKSGIITSNAERLRTKGADFYFEPWNESTGEFAPLTDEQRNAIAQAEIPAKPTSPAPEVPAEVVAEEPLMPDDGGFSGVGGLLDEDIPQAPEAPVAEQNIYPYEEIDVYEARKDAEIAISRASGHGKENLVKVSEALDVLGAEDDSTTMSQRINAFHSVLNYIFTKDELTEYGDKNIISIMIEYNDYLATPIGDKNSVFERIHNLVLYSDEVSSSMRMMASMMNDSTEGNDIQDIVKMVDVTKFANLPQGIQDAYREKFPNTDYDSLTPDAQEFNLTCLGVL